MRGGEQQRGTGRRRRTAAALSLAALVAFAGALPAADAKKKKKKKPAAVTRTANAPFAAGQSQQLNAACGKGTHVTGGGLAVAPNFTPPGSGLRSLAGTSHPSGAKEWAAGSSAFTNPAASGSLTTFVRCERDSYGQLRSIVSTSATLPPGAGQAFPLNCSPGTHVVSGGYSGQAASNLGNLLGFRLVVFTSRRTGAGQWTVNAFNSGAGPSPVPITVTVYALCEKNAKGRTVSERASPVVPLVNDARSSSDVGCAKKQHAISGGFNVTPNGVGSVPVVGLDEFYPTGRKGWHVGLHEWVGVALPPGSALQSFVYCKKD
jgi:hypothetical protein